MSKEKFEYWFVPVVISLLTIFSFISKSFHLGHSIIFVSLAGLYAYQLFHIRQQNPSIKQDIAKMREEFEKQLSEQKEFYGRQVARLEDEIGKVSLSVSRVAVSSSSPQKKDSGIRF